MDIHGTDNRSCLFCWVSNVTKRLTWAAFIIKSLAYVQQSITWYCFKQKMKIITLCRKQSDFTPEMNLSYFHKMFVSQVGEFVCRVWPVWARLHLFIHSIISTTIWPTDLRWGEMVVYTEYNDGLCLCLQCFMGLFLYIETRCFITKDCFGNCSPSSLFSWTRHTRAFRRWKTRGVGRNILDETIYENLCARIITFHSICEMYWFVPVPGTCTGTQGLIW